MKAMLWVGTVGSLVSLLTMAVGGEGVRAYAPFAVLSTGVLLLAFWAVASDHTPITHVGERKKAA